jgi:hypothetical protein
MISAPLHPQTELLAARLRRPRPAIQSVWRNSVAQCRFPLELASIGEIPLIGSAALIAAIDQRLSNLVTQLQPWIQQPADAQWPHCPPPDVLAADIAIVQSNEAPGWALRWVEFQAFTSNLATLILLRRAHAECWPELADQSPFGATLPSSSDGITAIGRVLAKHPEGIVLEHDAWQQTTRFDIEATSHLWRLPVVAPENFRAVSGCFEAQIENRWKPVPHILNRVILHQAPEPEALRRVMAAARATWHSHPAWFYRIDKGLLVELPLAAEERCVRADRWQELNLPAYDLVLKARHSFGGKDVLMHVDAANLQTLPDPQRWVVQPRYAPYPITHAHDGAPLFGEIRCMLALPANAPAWLMGRIVRMSRGNKSSMGTLQGAAGEGATLLYDPPDQ